MIHFFCNEIIETTVSQHKKKKKIVFYAKGKNNIYSDRLIGSF